ncbi:MAG: FKBP-type peptidyl-prolyl cis-trans isomerase [Muribaculaceae bacterium]|nr:FKBP-type peptidyl-prolyl cis-trans isomerase [Muribaculaceae bacterium]
MKKLPFALMILVALCFGMTACFDDENEGIEDEYRDWNKKNQEWLAAQIALKDAGGNPFYKKIVAAWDTASVVYMHWYNDRSKTANNLKPLYSSTVDVKYFMTNCDGSKTEDSYTRTSPGDSLFRARLNNDVIEGWAVAITQMHVGDSCDIIVPYNVGYGVRTVNGLNPYSNLKFSVKLVDIPFYETK